MFFLMIAAFYCFVAFFCAAIAVLLARHRFSHDFATYFAVGLVGGWIGAVTFGEFGILFAGVPVLAVVLCCATCIGIDYEVNCAVEEKHPVEPAMTTGHNPTTEQNAVDGSDGNARARCKASETIASPAASEKDVERTESKVA